MLEVHLECFTECLHVSAEGLVKSLLGEVRGVGGGEDGEDALLQALLRSLRTVGRDALVSSWGQLGGKIIFPEVSHQLMKKFSQSMFWGHWLRGAVQIFPLTMMQTIRPFSMNMLNPKKTSLSVLNVHM